MPKDYPDPVTATDWYTVDGGDLRYMRWLLEEPTTEAELATARRILATLATAPADDDPEQPTKFAVYRLLNPDGRVLYVGVSRNLYARLRVHRRDWGHLWDDYLVEWYPDAATMLEAEAQAIHDEQPPLNSEGIG